MSAILSKTILPVVLSGGSGSRLWPLSRKECPKQLLTIVGNKTLLQQTVIRFQNPAFVSHLSAQAHYENVLVVCNQSHVEAIESQLNDINASHQFIIEPHARGTAIALASVAAHFVDNDEPPVLLFVPSDHVIKNEEAFSAAIQKALPAAVHGAIVTFGATPTAPETGFGYILKGEPYADAPGCYGVKQFLEKPNQIAASYYLQEGNYYWNCGIFLARADIILAEMQRWRPDIANAAMAAVSKAEPKANGVVLDPEEMLRAQSESFDKAVMEFTEHAVIVPVDMGWSDVGSWDAVWQATPKDNGGNAVTGSADVRFNDSRNCYIHSDTQKIVTLGVENLVVIATADTIMVMPRDRAQDVKDLAQQ